MGRRRKTDEPGANGTAVLDQPAENNGTDTPVAKNRPAASFKARSDKTTSLECCVWGHEQEKDGEKWTQFTISVKRQWKGPDGWHDGGSFRIHDIPVLQYLLDRAYQFALSTRTEVKLSEDLPF